jgi:hypothetical protein
VKALLFAALLGLPTLAAAQATLAARLGDAPYRVVFEVQAGAAPVDVVADRRLVEVELRPVEGRGRRVHCRHPDAPRRIDAARVRTLAPGERYAEWFDLRMLCWGRRARARLEAGARATLRLRTRSRRDWVARQGEETTRTLEAAPFTWRPPPVEDAGASPLAVRLGPADARTEGGLRFTVRVQATVGRPRVYVRPDSFSFEVVGPGIPEPVLCAPVQGGGINPPPDLFRRLGGQRRVVSVLDVSYFCPEGTFEEAGVYGVTPTLTLRHDGAAYALDATVGTFVGAPQIVRLRRGGAGYLPHELE